LTLTTNYKEILRMKYAGFSERTIAKSLHCSRNTVSRCIQKAREFGISIPVAESTTNEQLYEHLYGSRREIRDPQYHYPDFKKLAEEMQKPHVTKGLLWTEYLLECKSVGLKPYSISQFNSLFRCVLSNRIPEYYRERFPGFIPGISRHLSHCLRMTFTRC